MGMPPTERIRNCPYCPLRLGEFKLIHDSAVTGLDEATDTRYWTWLSCPVCAGPVMVESTGPEDLDDVVSEIPKTTGDVYDVRHVPEAITSHYDEARDALEVGLHRSAAVQLRATMEAAAAHFGHDSGALYDRIQSLVDEGHITRVFGEAFNHIRRIGNAGAHHGDTVPDTDTINRALTFAAQLLRDLFEIPHELRLTSGD